MASGAAIPRASVMVRARPRESNAKPARRATSPNLPVPYCCSCSTRLSPPLVWTTLASGPTCSSKRFPGWKRSAGKIEYSFVSVLYSALSSIVAVSFPKP